MLALNAGLAFGASYALGTFFTPKLLEAKPTYDSIVKKALEIIGPRPEAMSVKVYKEILENFDGVSAAVHKYREAIHAPLSSEERAFAYSTALRAMKYSTLAMASGYVVKEVVKEIGNRINLKSEYNRVISAFAGAVFSASAIYYLTKSHPSIAKAVTALNYGCFMCATL